MKQRPKPKRPPDVHRLMASVNQRIEAWKSLAQRLFDTPPSIDQSTFEKEWPEILTNFFLSETARVARALKPIFEGFDN
jgi:hypothetical protein